MQDLKNVLAELLSHREQLEPELDAVVHAVKTLSRLPARTLAPSRRLADVRIESRHNDILGEGNSPSENI